MVIRPRRWGWLMARGFFGGISVLCYFACIERVPVGVASLLNQTQPIYTMLFAWLLIDERPSRAALVALPLTLAGVALIIGVDLRDLRGRGRRRQRAGGRDARRGVGDHLGGRGDVGACRAPRPGRRPAFRDRLVGLLLLHRDRRAAERAGGDAAAGTLGGDGHRASGCCWR